ncbi:hypothetical protein GQ600_13666 [Phytophthora cactorum]|nr:hypothetical protein GQ600_13666 [Phytophthora cactorum]
MKKLPLLVVTPATANLNAYVQGNNAVAVTKQDNLILESSQAYAFRIFAQIPEESATQFQFLRLKRQQVPSSRPHPRV